MKFFFFSFQYLNKLIEEKKKTLLLMNLENRIVLI